MVGLTPKGKASTNQLRVIFLGQKDIDFSIIVMLYFWKNCFTGIIQRPKKNFKKFKSPTDFLSEKIGLIRVTYDPLSVLGLINIIVTYTQV